MPTSAFNETSSTVPDSILLRNAWIPTGPWCPDAPAEPVWLALRGGLIVAVGRPGEPEPVGAFVTRDLLGAPVLPGFVDAHTHLGWSAQDRWTVNLSGLTIAAQVRQAISTVAGRVTAGDWITGGDDLPGVLPDAQIPDLAELDDAAGDHPLFLVSRDHSRAIANSAALRRAKIDAASTDPPGGLIERDSQGQPNGVLRGEAVWGRLLAGVVPPVNRARQRAEIADLLADLAARGVTELHDIGTVPETDTVPPFFRERSFTDVTLVAEWGEELPLRYSFRSSLLRADEPVPTDLSPMMEFGGYKMSLDNGWYSTSPDERLESFRWPGFDEALRLARLADLAGAAVSVHAMGDLGVAQVVELLGALPRRRSGVEPLHRIIHARRMSKESVARCAADAIAIETQPWEIAASGARLAALGDDEFAAGISPYRDLIDAGGLVIFGSDRRLGLRLDQADTDPLTAVQLAVTRSFPPSVEDSGGGHSGHSWQPDQALSLVEALACHTTNGTVAAGAAGRRGRIVAGSQADLVVLGGNPFAADPQEIRLSRPVLTVSAGRIMFDATGAV